MISFKLKVAYLFFAIIFLTSNAVNASNLFYPFVNVLDTIPLDLEEEEIFMLVEEMPRFPGCENELSKKEKQKCSNTELINYIASNLKYPSEAREKGLEGKVVVQFVVDKDGSIDDVDLIRDIGSGCGEEAVRVVENMNNLPKKWTPGKQRGNNVRVKYTLPFNFKLSDEDKKSAMNEIPAKMAKDTEVFTVVEESPRFPGCEDIKDVKERESCAQMELLKYIYSNIKYPKEAREKGIDGTVIVRFVVTPEGYIGDIEAIKKLDGGCTEESIRVVKEMNDMAERWIPGKQRDIPVHVAYNLPIKFKLEDEPKVKKN